MPLPLPSDDRNFDLTGMRSATIHRSDPQNNEFVNLGQFGYIINNLFKKMIGLLLNI